MIDEHEVMVPSGGLALSVSGLALSVNAFGVATSPEVGGKGFPVAFLALPLGELSPLGD